jgi:hypothetical protein
MAFLNISWHQWKAAMHHYAVDHGLPVPGDFNEKTPVCGTACHALLKEIQRHAGLAQDGILGPRTGGVLRPWFPLGGQRERMLAVGMWGVENEPAIFYAQIRPMNFNPLLPKTMDCSYFVTFCSYWANTKDPSGLFYSGEGNTTTMYYNLHHYPSKSDLVPGDLIIWGGEYLHTLSHVAIWKGDGYIISHGSTQGPLDEPLSVEEPYHAGLSETFCRLSLRQ